MIFIFQFVDVVYYVDLWVLEEFLHPWDDFCLIMLFDLFNVVLDLD